MTLSELPHLSRRRFLQGMTVVGGALAGGVLLAACGNDDETSAAGTTAAAAGGGKIGLSLNGLVEYTKGVASGVYQALDGSGYDLVVLQANFDAATETANLENLIAQGVKGLVIQPNTADGAAAGAKAASEKGIPVSNCLWPGPSENDKYYAGVAALDSVAGGRLIGEWLKANVPGGGKVCVVQGVVGQGFSERIDEGLDEALSGSNLEVVVRQQGFFDRAQAVKVVEDAFQANPDIAVIVDYAATMSNGISQWLKDNGKDKVVHVTSDADSEMLDWIKTPYLSATRYYSSAETGLIAAKAVLAKLKGEEVEFQTPVTQLMATAENIDKVVADNPFFYEKFAAQVNAI
jgi:ribose transport system substrate-binding protein